jgi:putative membrane protein
MQLADNLAALNATLNGLSGLLLVVGWRIIRSGRTDPAKRQQHRTAMLSAFAISGLFLMSYLARVALSGTHPYPPDAPGRLFYLAMLATHVPLAATVPFLAVAAIWLAHKQRFAQHVKVVRVALPVWLYVSVTGVGVYVMLYHVAGV